MNFDQAVEVCKDLVQNEGIQALTLRPGFTHQAVAKVVNAVGEGISVSVARGDTPSAMIAGQILRKEGCFSKHSSSRKLPKGQVIYLYLFDKNVN